MKIGDLRQKLQNVMIFDGGFGTELYRRNFFVNTSYDDLCLSAPATVAAIHQSYVDAGAEVLTTNTYNANAASLQQFGIADRTEKINQAAVAIARKAAAGKPEILIAGSIGPAKDANASAIVDQAVFLRDAGADFLLFESVDTLEKLRCTLKAVESCECEWVLSFTFDPNR